MKNRIPNLLSLVAISGGFLTSPTYANNSDTLSKLNANNAHDEIQEKVSALATSVHTLLLTEKDNPEFKRMEAELSNILSKLQLLPNLSNKQEQTIGWALNRLAILHCPSQRSFDEQEFAKGNAYKIRELEFHNRLHPDRENLIRNNLGLLNWYIDRQRNVEAEKQLKVLSEFLGTIDRKMLEKQSHHRCGELSEDFTSTELEQVSKQTGILACGIG